jgi:LacI family transcriptional regulator
MNTTVDEPTTADSSSGGGGHRTTLQSVAQVAGVSMSTASKVVNGRTGVGLETRHRVEAAISKLGYVSLGERQVGSLAATEAMVELLVDPRDVTNPYLSLLLGGAMESAEQLRAGLVLRSIDAAMTRDPIPWAQSLARAGRSGVIEVTSTYSPRREKALRAVGLPMVLVDPIDVPRTSVASIGATNWAGAYAATKHLLELGHRRIAYLGGPLGAGCDIIRAHGWAAAMSEAGIIVDSSAVLREAYTFEHGLRAGTELLKQRSRPTAIFAGSDISAMGVLEAARQLGIAVPAQLSVVGFDDTVLASTSTPPLTTVHQPIADIGRLAVSTVLRLARGENLSTKRVELATDLVIRDSTAPVPQGVRN